MVTVLDLRMLKCIMRIVVSSLVLGDRLSIVTFLIVGVKRLLPLRWMSRQGQHVACKIMEKFVLKEIN
ncbi:hypothetical protein MUK42_05879 [Musa troglodytarum]|uniref:Uncharacterized protein n=1 Tax=Musa troglodytarum TaxID=320322 RepID=A0A9E7GZP1_9LILI|nr:hypothetical protein MUK42_05879 [Musa troglodytarum]